MEPAPTDVKQEVKEEIKQPRQARKTSFTEQEKEDIKAMTKPSDMEDGETWTLSFMFFF